MQAKNKISVCIPTYNKSGTIEYTLRSVINQSYEDWELIVIDDSNNELTEIVLKKFSKNDTRIKYFRNKERLGLVKNWNECIRQASYDYIYILHHDDFLMPGVLQAYSEFAKNQPKCGLIHSNCYYITLPYYRQTIGITQDESLLEKGDKAVEKILFRNNIACSSVMVKKECYQRLGGFDENAWVSPDWEMWARIGKHYDLGHLNIEGCAVIDDSQNTHKSGIDIFEFSRQQRYYFQKIISYFSEEYTSKHPDIFERAEDNLKRTILGLGIYYVQHFRFDTANKYFNSIKYYNILKIIFISLKSTAKVVYSTIFLCKSDYHRVFKIFYKSLAND